ncbi:MAG: site-specific integrase [Bacteroidota bacterium]|nr:site-specific integrase [Bacteroidota bacterium]
MGAIRQTFAVAVFQKKSAKSVSKPEPLYLRITMNGQRAEISLNRKILSKHWNASKALSDRGYEDYDELNDYLEECRARVRRCKFELERTDQFVSAYTIKDRYLGKDDQRKNVLEVFQEYIKYKTERVGVDISPATVQKYKRCKVHLENFISKKYRRVDLALVEVTYEFIMSFEHYLRTVAMLSRNTSVKTIRAFRTVIIHALANDWLAKDPFIKVRLSEEQIERESLTMEELQKIWKKEFKIERIQQVADIFLFGCFTGMAYSDLKELTVKELIDGATGKKWIIKKRKKTGTPINIRLPEPAIMILEKYAQHPVRLRNGKLLPVSSNQKMNAYLKEVGDLCGITKSLTTHMARHTFATTLGIGLGMPLNVVSRVLAHRSQSMTEHYARIGDQVIDQEMTKVDNAFKVSRTA